VVTRDAERARLGYVTRVAVGEGSEIALSVTLWPGVPRSLAVRPTSIAFSEELPLPTIMLSGMPGEADSLIVPPRTFNPGRLLRSMDTGPERKVRLTRLLQRGGDFERVSFEEA